jgi:hypothetical protein
MEKDYIARRGTPRQPLRLGDPPLLAAAANEILGASSCSHEVLDDPQERPFLSAASIVPKKASRNTHTFWNPLSIPVTMSSEPVESPTELLATALQLMSQEWTKLSLGDDPAVAATADLAVVTQRLTALLLVRIVAVVYDRHKETSETQLPDFSTTTICRTLLVHPEAWPAPLTPTVVEELQAYVGNIVSRYYPTSHVPYHNAEHAFHVTISMNKLLDMMLSRRFGEGIVAPSFGLRHQPLALFAMVFAALVHDVEHTGVANRVLATEESRLAIQYNDQSVAENRSLYVAFDELLRPGYRHLRDVLCPEAADHHVWRKHVINLVLHTDIASPEKTQLGRSKWKEAFHDPSQSRRRSNEQGNKNSNSGDAAKTIKSNTSLASLRIGDKSSATGDSRSSDEPSIDTIGTDSDEPSNDEVPEQAPPRQRRFQRNGDAPPAEDKTKHKPIIRSANKKRLGIRRSMDLSGEVLDSYSNPAAAAAAQLEADKPDELKMTVVMETLMQAADVAHNLQSWDHMVEWSCRLYLELRRAYVQGRGPDVAKNWFPNQIGFLELYLEPLAKKLETVGVFGAMIGPSFARIVKASRDRWLLDGMEVTQAVIDAGVEWYPEGGEVEDLPELGPMGGGDELGESVKIQELETKLKRMERALANAERAATGTQQNGAEQGQLLKLEEELEGKDNSLAALQAEIFKLKRSQAKQRSQMEKEIQRRLHEHECNSDKTEETPMQNRAAPLKSISSSSHASGGSSWQNLVIVCLTFALLWTKFQNPILNNLCAPAAPGTKIVRGGLPAEAPWWAPDDMKASAFVICGQRTRVRVESSKGKLTLSYPDGNVKKDTVAKRLRFNHAIVEADGLVVVNKKGASRSIDAPWYSSS